MLVDPKPEDSQGRAASEPVLGRSRYAKTVAAVLIAGAVSLVAYRVVLAPSHYRGGELVQKAAPVLREGDRIVVPEGSPVRDALAVAPVAPKDIRRDLVLPAVVEADVDVVPELLEG